MIAPLEQLLEPLATVIPAALTGTVVRMEGLMVAVADFPAPIGAQVTIERAGAPELAGEVIAFRDHHTLVFPSGPTSGVRFGNRVRLARTTSTVRVGPSLLGRVLDAFGKPLDGQAPPFVTHRVPVHRSPPKATSRPRIDQPLSTGIRAIDGLLTCGRGQRIGIFSGAGVGKSVTLGMMARYTSADVNVIALIGERGREVNDFLERDLGAAGRARSVVVVATSDQPAIVRVRASFVATSIAEYFRDRGSNVLLMMDSVTRFAMAQREIGLAAGEPPTTKGYPPSMYSLLPRLVERSGRTPTGSITGFYTVLVEGDDTNEPVSDTMRGLLDGHLILSRKLASKGNYPAIDILESISRVMPDITSKEHRQAIQTIRELMGAYRDHEDLISIGAYRAGANPMVDTAIGMLPDLQRFLKQEVEQVSSVEVARGELLQLAQRAANLRAAPATANTASKNIR